MAEENDMQTEDTDDRAYVVVLNEEEQYSIWFADRDVPPGWKAVGVNGTKAECLDYIGRSWTDMTPLSVRKAIVAPGASHLRQKPRRERR